MPASTRLPGIQFDVVAPAVPEALVRMDIAVFVGFAASGPLQRPVMVEDTTRFEEIFGADLPLANETGSKQSVNAYLPSAVRAFFRNGGRRCWVIRVAGAGAIANQFPLPGVFEIQGHTLTRAHAEARSEGSWSDNLAVGAALRSQFIEVASFAGDPHAVGLLLSASDDVVSGDLLKFTYGTVGEVLWFFVDSVTPVTIASPPPGSKRGRMVTVQGQNVFSQLPGSPPSSGSASLCQHLAADVLDDSSRTSWTFGDVGLTAAVVPINPVSPPAPAPVCERLTMDLFVQGDSQVWSLTNLGFAPSHPRYWAGLPDDRCLYASDTSATPQGLAAEAAHPRFPLGFSLTGKEGAKGLYLPLCVGPLPEEFAGPDLASAADPIERDGVAAFDWGLFLDPSLTDTTAVDLLREADFIRYQSSHPRRLTGIHAALEIDEATIIAVPDAVQRGWTKLGPTPLASPPDSSPLAHPEWWHFLDCNTKSNIPLVAGPPLGQFEPCDLLIVDPPALHISGIEGGRYSLQWTPLAGAVDLLEEAVDSSFISSAVIYQGSSGSSTIYGRPAGDYFYRMRRQVGSVSSNYSNGIGFRVSGPTDWLVNPANAYQDNVLLAVHTGLLRMCAARGDMFGVLAMPQHYRETQAMVHAAELKSILDAGEQNAYSFGALYHPWLTGHEENDLLNLRTNPPDGAMAGIMALRSTERGPWISPANEPLHGVVDLAPTVLKSSRQELQDSLINLVRQEPEGFLCLCELTLTDDPDVSPINVRRLLSFLRKTVLRAGTDYVFEPNSVEFRRSVQRGFEILMDGLLQRGAFAGRTARESYQVRTDSSLNTPQAVDRGEFFVELWVAPSLPMRFLTIRLLQTADRTFVTEGG
jgi:hypothetical protein